jgi:hypothetical protein
MKAPFRPDPSPPACWPGWRSRPQARNVVPRPPGAAPPPARGGAQRPSRTAAARAEPKVSRSGEAAKAEPTPSEARPGRDGGAEVPAKVRQGGVTPRHAPPEALSRPRDRLGNRESTAQGRPARVSRNRTRSDPHRRTPRRRACRQALPRALRAVSRASPGSRGWYEFAPSSCRTGVRSTVVTRVGRSPLGLSGFRPCAASARPRPAANRWPRGRRP